LRNADRNGPHLTETGFVTQALAVSNKSGDRQMQHRHRCRCGALIAAKRTGRKAKFCSDRCRSEARRARSFVSLGRSSGASRNDENSIAKSNGCKGHFAGRAYSIIAPPDVIAAEVFGGSDWQSIVSPDGVRCEVAKVGPSAAARTNDASALIAQIPADLSIPDFLRRLPPLPVFASEQVAGAAS
jgi:hypothetical protein